MQQMTRQEKLEFIAANYMKAMWQKAYSVISDVHEAEDACQEAFIKIIRVIDDIEDITELRAKAFCCIIAKNTAIDMGRKNAHAAPTEDLYLELEAEAPGQDAPDEIAASNEGIQRLAEQIAELPESYQDVLRLRCLYEMSAEQTAQLLGMNANAVNIKLSRARKMLRAKIEQDRAGFLAYPAD